MNPIDQPESIPNAEQIRAAALERAFRDIEAEALRLSEPSKLPTLRGPNRRERRASKSNRRRK